MAAPVALVAPATSQLGGGIKKEIIGESTERYEQYFDENAEKPDELKKKRLLNYADVVVRAHTCRCYPDGAVLSLNWQASLGS